MASNKAGRPAQPAKTIIQSNQLDPVSQALTDRYLSQQSAGQGAPSGQRSPHLVEQVNNSVANTPGVHPNSGGGSVTGQPLTGSSSSGQ